MKLERLEKEFFARDTLRVAKHLIGKHLVRHVEGQTLIARIVETEAYTGDDAACHAHANMQRLREGHAPRGRSSVLFGEPGSAYVYFNYGMYWLFNIVTESLGTPGAVLVRAVEPVAGIETMRRFRPRAKRDHELGNGPGKLALALRIGPEFNGVPLQDCRELYVASDGRTVPARQIASSPRVGISKAQELPWRFYLAGNPCVSKPQPRGAPPSSWRAPGPAPCGTLAAARVAALAGSIFVALLAASQVLWRAVLVRHDRSRDLG